MAKKKNPFIDLRSGPTLVGAAALTTSSAGTLLSLLCYAPALVMFTIGSIRWALQPAHDRAAEHRSKVEAAIKSLYETVCLSDAAKQVVFHETNRQMLRHAIDEQAARGEFDAALRLVDQLSDAFGRDELARMRIEINETRRVRQQEQIDRELATLDGLIEQQAWDKAHDQAMGVERRHSSSVRAHGLSQKVKDAKEQYKHSLERRFLEASQREEVDLAMELMKELDKYLSEVEAEPFREAARGVIMKKRENLAVQFKLAVHDNEWTEAVRVGEQIISNFANTKMAEEVHGMIEVLRKRAADRVSSK